MGEWQSIETAPKDGTKLLLFYDKRGSQIGWWVETETLRYGKSEQKQQYWLCLGAFMWAMRDEVGDPTHWMPLPAAPI